MRNTPGVLQGGSVPESGSSYENTRLPTNPPPPQGGRERLLIIMLLINNMQICVIG
jgi:hypothetical protein